MLVLTPTVAEELSSLAWFQVKFLPPRCAAVSSLEASACHTKPSAKPRTRMAKPCAAHAHAHTPFCTLAPSLSVRSQSWWAKLGEHIAETAVSGVDAIIVHMLSMAARDGETSGGHRTSAHSKANTMHKSCLKAASVLLTSHHHADKNEGKSKLERQRTASGELGSDERKPRGHSSKKDAQGSKASASKGKRPKGTGSAPSGGGHRAKGDAKPRGERRKSLLESFADTIMGRADPPPEPPVS